MDSSNVAYKAAAYLRVASIAIAAYDALESHPTAVRFYREHLKKQRITISVILFVLIRFVSVCTLIISNVGFFYGRFTIESCRRFHLFPPAFKVLQIMVSQAILAFRAYNVSRRSPVIGYFLLFVYSAASVLQWVATMHQRTAQLGAGPAPGQFNCRAFNSGGNPLFGAWFFYAIAIVYDVLTTSLAVFYLLRFSLRTTNSLTARIAHMMLYDGLGYLAILTGINVLNLILYKSSPEIQTAGSSLGYCVTWVMSQRLLVHLYQVSQEDADHISYHPDAEGTLSKNRSDAECDPSPTVPSVKRKSIHR